MFKIEVKSILDSTIVSKIFTNRELERLVNTGKSKYIKLLSNFQNEHPMNELEAIQMAYKYFSKHYRNEYFYKNELLNKIVLGRHSLNTTSALRELPVANSIADFIIFNGKAEVYEIKTELDNLNRLSNQIEDYYKAFKFVNVITNDKYVKDVLKIIDKDTGVYTLTRRKQIHCVRKASEHSSKLDSYTMFNILRKPEFEEIIKRKYGVLPKVGASKYYDACFKVFNGMPIVDQQKMLTIELKQRYLHRFKNKNRLLLECPMELRELVYFSTLNDKEIEKLNVLIR